ncbi:oligopeptidase F, Metallo peptidase, MEROPS family M03B [Desulforamulus reducens MI-1]|uniref:Oligopeptidase F n=1 Tax=Desulforamulus reducens (strain ATCC BAA-1160 / DSM 100696 / MI-1) TaxID=349161 RepID=A4J7B4_DESRM|nr:oligoendopeptidase F [Desulforamulus reducens]ABO50967.1 oligopeptidase F, Metallo peptidase, MEROPS family M03B [Desulforamulus reducens MI-1]
MNTNIKNRDEIEEQFKWNLSTMYKSVEEVKQDMKKIKDLLNQFKGYQGKLTDKETLLKALLLQDQMDQLVEKCYTYSHMKLDEDNTNTQSLALFDQVRSLFVLYSEDTSFFVPEIMKLDFQQLSCYAKDERFQDYRHFIREIGRNKEHILSDSEEKLLSSFGEIAGAPKSIFQTLNNADLKFGEVKDENNETVELTHGRYQSLIQSRHRDVRKAAYNELYRVYKCFKNTIAQTFINSVKKDCLYARLRKYNSALEASTFSDNVAVSVYNNLIASIHRNIPLLHQYIKFRKGVMQLPELYMYDLYVPLVTELNKKYSYQEAVDMVLKGLNKLGDQYVSNLRQGLENGWVDIYENKGKTSGAYSTGAYGNHPYILLNYNGTMNDVFTLAHEAGHAMHTLYSHKNQPYRNASYTIFVAEVASTLNENLLMKYLLDETKDPKEKLFLLNYNLEQVRTTVFRQTMFAEFEKITHEKVEQGESLTPDSLCEIYYELNKFYYQGVQMDDEIALEWARIPHFYNAFYVYKYATGFSAAVALSKGILEGGQNELNKYLEFLSSGGKDYPIELLKKAGVDMATPQPVEACLQSFGENIKLASTLI